MVNFEPHIYFVLPYHEVWQGYSQMNEWTMALRYISIWLLALYVLYLLISVDFDDIIVKLVSAFECDYEDPEW